MEAVLRVGAADEVIAVLRETTPFGEASEALLQRIAAIARPARFAAGARIYSAGNVADVNVFANGAWSAVASRSRKK